MRASIDVRILSRVLGAEQQVVLNGWHKADAEAMTRVVLDWLEGLPESTRNSLQPRGAAPAGARCWHEVRHLPCGRHATVEKAMVTFYGVQTVSQELDAVIVTILEAAEFLAALNAVSALAPAFAQPTATPALPTTTASGTGKGAAAGARA